MADIQEGLWEVEIARVGDTRLANPILTVGANKVAILDGAAEPGRLQAGAKYICVAETSIARWRFTGAVVSVNAGTQDTIQVVSRGAVALESIERPV